MSNTLKEFQKAVEQRRSFYAIGKGPEVSEEEILGIVRHEVQHVPSAFNSQGARVIVLLGAAHDRLWNLTRDILRGIVPAEGFASTEQKLDSFRAGIGTVLFFEDQAVVEGLQQQFALYKDNFPVWSLQSSGMLQYAVWTALEAAGLGASLQHYNPLIDQKVREAWNVPESWRLLGEMPFGRVLAQPDAKTFVPLEQRFRVEKA